MLPLLTRVVEGRLISTKLLERSPRSDPTRNCGKFVRKCVNNFLARKLRNVTLGSRSRNRRSGIQGHRKGERCWRAGRGEGESRYSER